MNELQVLVATMHQKDFSLIEKMNIRCSAVIANQTDSDKEEKLFTEKGLVKIISTKTRGVGLNRNIALKAADAEIIFFADDDVRYNDDMPEKVKEAFDNFPEADVIIFSVDITKNGEIIERRYLKNKRLHIWNSMRFGTYAIAARRKKIVENNIIFNENFGGGCIYSSGEDSLFIKNCLDCGLKIYSNEYVLGTCCKDTSSWFVGFNDKYFYDKGALLRFLFPKLKYIMGIYFAIRFKGKTEVSTFKRLKLIYTGIVKSKNLTPYGKT